MYLRRHVYDTASYKKRVVCEFLFNVINYESIAWRIGAKNSADRYLRNVQVGEAKSNLMKTLPGTNQYDMSWWRRWKDENKLRYGLIDMSSSANETAYETVAMWTSEEVLTIHPSEAQPDESDTVRSFLPPLEGLARSWCWMGFKVCCGWNRNSPWLLFSWILQRLTPHRQDLCDIRCSGRWRRYNSRTRLASVSVRVL